MSKKTEYNEGEKNPRNPNNKNEGHAKNDRKRTASGRPGYLQPKDKKGPFKYNSKEEGKNRERKEKPYGKPGAKNTGRGESRPKFFQPKDARPKTGGGRERPFNENSSLRPERTGKLSYNRGKEDKPYSERSSKPSYSKGRDNTSSYGAKDDKRKSFSKDDKPYNSERGAKGSFSKGKEGKPYGAGGDRKGSSHTAYNKETGKTSYAGRRDIKPTHIKEEGKSSNFRKGGNPYGSERAGSEPGFRDKDTKSNYSRGDDKKSSFRKDDNAQRQGRSEKTHFSRDKDEKPSFGRGEKKSYESRGEKRTSSRGDIGENPIRTEREVSRDREKRNTSGRFDNEKGNGENPEKKPRIPKRAPEKKDSVAEPKNGNGDIRLNRFIANAGICSRRDADLLIQAGEITVNGEIVTEMGYKVNYGDDIRYNKKKLKREKMVYVLLNKPKDFITTTEDPENRKTIMQLVDGAGGERIYPVGRLDRNTTGLILLTNDGELAEKLSHPSNNMKKLYQVDLDKPITEEDLLKIREGVILEDGLAEVDQVAIVTSDKTSLGLQIHSGKNRIVRRIFEHLGYDVVKLDRVMYAGLDKKDLPRGKWRMLSEQEVIRLKFMK
ncbi:MAG: rRNA pseudouridine synthase [Bacteroidota bacterium]|nr:rRNA pseudouridine synthase [Bacteroidota bacterium]